MTLFKGVRKVGVQCLRFLVSSCLIFLFFVLPVTLKAEDDGFLAVNFEFIVDKAQNSESSQVRLRTPISFTGSSSYYNIYTKFLLVSDLAQVGNYFSGSEDFLNSGELYDFSYGSWQISNRLLFDKYYSLLLGLELGHRGFLAQSIAENPFSIYAGFVAIFYVFFTKSFAIRQEAGLPFHLAKSNADSIFEISYRGELILDFTKSIRNPNAGTYFLSLGCGVFYFNLDDSGAGYQSLAIRPLLRFSFVY